MSTSDLNNFLTKELLFFVPLVSVLLLFCWFVNRPLNRIRLLGDTGYIAESGHSKADLVNKVRRQRKIGRLPAVYPNGWFCIAESRDFKPGQVKKTVALGQNLVVFRARDSHKVYALDAYCPHMGADLGVGGVVTKGNCIQCPFHGWNFRGDDGKCTEIPYACKIPKFAKTKHWPCVEKNKHIYFWYAGCNINFNFPVIKFPHSSSLLPKSIKLNVISSQLYRILGICTCFVDFVQEADRIAQTYMSKNYAFDDICMYFLKFIVRYHTKFSKYGFFSKKKLVRWFLEHWNIQGKQEHKKYFR